MYMATVLHNSGERLDGLLTTVRSSFGAHVKSNWWQRAKEQTQCPTRDLHTECITNCATCKQHSKGPEPELLFLELPRDAVLSDTRAVHNAGGLFPPAMETLLLEEQPDVLILGLRMFAPRRFKTSNWSGNFFTGSVDEYWSHLGLQLYRAHLFQSRLKMDYLPNAKLLVVLYPSFYM